MKATKVDPPFSRMNDTPLSSVISATSLTNVTPYKDTSQTKKNPSPSRQQAVCLRQ